MLVGARAGFIIARALAEAGVREALQCGAVLDFVSNSRITGTSDCKSRFSAPPGVHGL
jgi:hypothetical protein